MRFAVSAVLPEMNDRVCPSAPCAKYRGGGGIIPETLEEEKAVKLRLAIVIVSMGALSILCKADPEEDYEVSYEELLSAGAVASGASFTAEAQLDQTDVFVKVNGIMTNSNPGTMIRHYAWATDGNKFEGTTTLEAPEWRVWNKRVARCHVWVPYYSAGPGTTYQLQSMAMVESLDACGWSESSA